RERPRGAATREALGRIDPRPVPARGGSLLLQAVGRRPQGPRRARARRADARRDPRAARAAGPPARGPPPGDRRDRGGRHSLVRSNRGGPEGTGRGPAIEVSYERTERVVRLVDVISVRYTRN